MIVVVQSALFALVLFTKTKEKRGNLYLGLLLTTVAINFAYNFLLANQLASHALISLSASYGFLYGPLAYFYVRSSLIKEYKFSRVSALNFLPFVAVVAGAIAGIPWFPQVALVLLGSMSVYVVFSLRLIIQYQKATWQALSDNGRREVRWMKFFFYAMIMIIVTNLVQGQLYPVIYIVDRAISTEIFIHLSILLLVNIVTVQGLRNPSLFMRLSKQEFVTKADHKKTGGTNLYSQSLLNEILDKLNTYVSEGQPYTDPELTVNKLADAINVHPKALSQAINTQLGSNFSDYINSLRIAYVKERLESQTDESQTIVEVMYDAGFNSRSVFNTLFKKKTGLTPSEYRKQL